MFYDSSFDYLSFLPEIYLDKKEAQALAEAVNMEADACTARLRQHVANCFPSEADEEGVSRWEKILGVTTPLGSGLKARREALVAKLMTKPPINLTTLRSIIEAYMGVKVDLKDTGEKVIDVGYQGEIRIADLTPLFATIYEIIPANMLVSIHYVYMLLKEVQAKTVGQLGEVRLKEFSFEGSKK